MPVLMQTNRAAARSPYRPPLPLAIWHASSKLKPHASGSAWLHVYFNHAVDGSKQVTNKSKLIDTEGRRIARP
jgi:hypothetical protein